MCLRARVHRPSICQLSIKTSTSIYLYAYASHVYLNNHTSTAHERYQKALTEFAKKRDAAAKEGSCVGFGVVYNIDHELFVFALVK